MTRFALIFAALLVGMTRGPHAATLELISSEYDSERLKTTMLINVSSEPKGLLTKVTLEFEGAGKRGKGVGPCICAEVLPGAVPIRRPRALRGLASKGRVARKQDFAEEKQFVRQN